MGWSRRGDDGAGGVVGRCRRGDDGAGVDAMTDLEQIAKEATDHGMTYGEYVAWKARATIEQQRNYRRARQVAEIQRKRGKKK